MKIYQRLEQILKFRIYSNAEIPEYLKKLTLMGKIDDVKKIALFNLILTVLGEMEDKEEEKVEIPPPAKEYTTTTINTDIPITLANDITFKCPDCDFIAKSEFGLQSHSRKHKK